MKKTIAALVVATAAAGITIAHADQGDDKGLGGRHGQRAAARAERLERFDANHNGVLDPEEKAAARAEWEAHRKERQARLLERFDANHNGVLDPEEKDAAKTTFRANRGRQQARMIEKFDTNHNGTIDPEDVRQRHQRKNESR